MMRRALAFLAVFLFTLPAFAAEGSAVDMRAVTADIHAKGDALIAEYDPTDGATVSDGFSDLYFDVFEASGMEKAIGAASPSEKTELESLFGQVIGKAGQGAPKAQVEAAWTQLRDGLQRVSDAHSQRGDGPLAAFLQAFLILLREGFEAMLVVTALVAYLRRSGQGEKVTVIWQGVVWALLASLGAAWALTQFISIQGAGQEVLEGIVMLVAAAVLFYVSFWLLSKRETGNWQAYVKSQVDAAAASGRMWALGLAAFLAVFREGAETVLFYQALALSAPGSIHMIAAGFATAAAALVALYIAMRALSFRLPLKLFFTGTAALLFFLSVSFAGKGILELQEGRLVSITPLDFMPRVELLGLFPTAESVAAQLVLIIPMAVALVWLFSRRRA